VVSTGRLHACKGLFEFGLSDYFPGCTQETKCSCRDRRAYKVRTYVLLSVRRYRGVGSLYWTCFRKCGNERINSTNECFAYLSIYRSHSIRSAPCFLRPFVQRPRSKGIGIIYSCTWTRSNPIQPNQKSNPALTEGTNPKDRMCKKKKGGRQANGIERAMSNRAPGEEKRKKSTKNQQPLKSDQRPSRKRCRAGRRWSPRCPWGRDKRPRTSGRPACRQRAGTRGWGCWA
jgi:hypothetical protein